MSDSRCEKAANSIIGAWTRGAPFEACCAYVQDAINDALAAAEARVAKLTTEQEVMRLALRSACTPPWPSWATPDDVSIKTLMAFYLRQARELLAVNAAEEQRETKYERTW